MRYVMSDVHGEYELFIKLMKKIGCFCIDTCRAFYAARS